MIRPPKPPPPADEEAPPQTEGETGGGGEVPAPEEYASWSAKELKQALARAGVSHGWANTKEDLVALAVEHRVRPARGFGDDAPTRNYSWEPPDDGAADDDSQAAEPASGQPAPKEAGVSTGGEVSYWGLDGGGLQALNGLNHDGDAVPLPAEAHLPAVPAPTPTSMLGGAGAAPAGTEGAAGKGTDRDGSRTAGPVPAGSDGDGFKTHRPAPPPPTSILHASSPAAPAAAAASAGATEARDWADAAHTADGASAGVAAAASSPARSAAPASPVVQPVPRSCSPRCWSRCRPSPLARSARRSCWRWERAAFGGGFRLPA